jgi:hypothetical protein
MSRQLIIDSSSTLSGGNQVSTPSGDHPRKQQVNRTLNRTPNRTPKRTSPGNAPPSSNGETPAGKSVFNFIQINTHKSKLVFNDLASYITGKENPIILVQEPHSNSRNVISRLTRDMSLICNIKPTRRPRACIFIHKSLINKCWFMAASLTRTAP